MCVCVYLCVCVCVCVHVCMCVCVCACVCVCVCACVCVCVCVCVCACVCACVCVCACPTEECAYRVLTSDRPDDDSSAGIPIIIKAYELHRDNAEVVEAIVNLIMELCEYGQFTLPCPPPSLTWPSKGVTVEGGKGRREWGGGQRAQEAAAAAVLIVLQQLRREK